MDNFKKSKSFKITVSFALAVMCAILINVSIICVYELWWKNYVINFMNNSVKDIKSMFWPYGELANFVLIIAIISIIVVTLMLKKRWSVLVIIISMSVLFILVAQGVVTIWWSYTNTLCWCILLFRTFYDSNNKKEHGTNSEKNKDKQSDKLNAENVHKSKSRDNKKHDKWSLQKIKYDVQKIRSSIFNFSSRHNYIIKRFAFGLIISTIALVFVSIIYAVKFKNIQSGLRSFLELKIYIDNSSTDFVAQICAAVLVVLPIVITVLTIFKLQKTNLELATLHESFEENKVKELKAKKEKMLFQAIVFGMCIVAFIPIIIVIVPWAEQQVLNINMVIYGWFILFVLSLVIINLLSMLIDWLEKDNKQSHSLPRTTIFISFVATIVSAVVSAIIKG